MFELPQFDEQPRERADAARNRERILSAAGVLVAESGIDAVSMEAFGGRAARLAAARFDAELMDLDPPRPGPAG